MAYFELSANIGALLALAMSIATLVFVVMTYNAVKKQKEPFSVRSLRRLPVSVERRRRPRTIIA